MKDRSKSEDVSPTSSPPRKRQEVTIEEIDDNEVEMLDIGIEAEAVIQNLLEKRIRELEARIIVMEIEKKNEEKVRKQLEKELNDLKEKNTSTKEEKLPRHFSNVKQEHIPYLKGFKIRYMAEPDGACLTDCVAVHAHEDKREAKKVKRMINHHIAKNFETYYWEKVAIPFVETVGVGKRSKTVRKNTQEEYIDFLMSEESLHVFSNSQELLAIANIYNIKINVFTYGNGEPRWDEIHPDKALSSASQFKEGTVPEMFLYHSFETHYDLLVKEDSRIIENGVFVGIPVENMEKEKVLKDGQQSTWKNMEAKTFPDLEVNNFGWQKVPIKKRKFRYSQDLREDERLLEEVPNTNDDKIDISEEMTLFKNKNNGHRRTAPQQEFENGSKPRFTLKCDNCEKELESQGLLDAHIKTMHASVSEFQCDKCENEYSNEDDLRAHIANIHENKFQFICEDCDDEFQNGEELKRHMEKEHKKKKYDGVEWNCDGCCFQGDGASQLLNHLKLTGHQPSKSQQDNRKIFKYFRK